MQKNPPKKQNYKNNIKEKTKYKSYECLSFNPFTFQTCCILLMRQTGDVRSPEILCVLLLHAGRRWLNGLVAISSSCHEAWQTTGPSQSTHLLPGATRGLSLKATLLCSTSYTPTLTGLLFFFKLLDTDANKATNAVSLTLCAFSKNLTSKIWQLFWLKHTDRGLAASS